MSPERARVCIIDDNKRLRETRETMLSLIGGHEVVLTAGTLQKALDIIPLFREKGVQVALVDGNLSSGDVSGNDGKMVAKAIRSQVPEVKTIGTSGLGYVEGVDKNHNPTKDTLRDLVKLVTDL